MFCSYTKQFFISYREFIYLIYLVVEFQKTSVGAIIRKWDSHLGCVRQPHYQLCCLCFRPKWRHLIRFHLKNRTLSFCRYNLLALSKMQLEGYVTKPNSSYIFESNSMKINTISTSLAHT